MHENPLTLTLSPLGRGEGTGDSEQERYFARTIRRRVTHRPTRMKNLSPQGRGEGIGEESTSMTERL